MGTQLDCRLLGLLPGMPAWKLAKLEGPLTNATMAALLVLSVAPVLVEH